MLKKPWSYGRGFFCLLHKHNTIISFILTNLVAMESLNTADGYNLLNSSRALFNKLLEDYKFFADDALSASKALNYTATAWHLTDWVYHEYESSTCGNLGTMRDAFFSLCPELRVMHDLATGLKHYTVSRPKSNMSGNHMAGVFARQFARQFDVTRLVIDFADGSSEDIESIFEKVMSFWKQYFDGKK